MTSFYDRHIMPKLIGCACASKPIMKQRAKVVPLAKGRVLELGIGGGLNLAFYDPKLVSSVEGVDPSDELRAFAEAAPRPEGLNVTIARERPRPCLSPMPALTRWSAPLPSARCKTLLRPWLRHGGP